MRIAVTGVTTDLGLLVAGQLVAAGHQVTGMAQHGHRDLDPRVELVCAPLDSPALQELTADAEALIHLAPVEPEVPESAGISGIVHVTQAASRSGTRLLFCTHAAGDPELYDQAAELVSSSWGPTLVIRLAPLVGRIADWAVCRTAVTLLAGKHDGPGPIRVLHTDDLCRFLARAVGSHRTGQVDLATADGLTYVTARRLLAPIGTPPRRLPSWQHPDPGFRLIPLQRDWEFECGWSAGQAVADMAGALTGRRLGHSGATPLRRHLPIPAEVIASVGVQCTAPQDAAGEFDYPIDPRFPVFSTAGCSDALPGPLTPMTLDIALGATRRAQRATAEAMGLPEPLAAEWEARSVAVFGHRLYTGVSICAAIAPLVPGASADGISRLLGAGQAQYPTPSVLRRTAAGAATVRRMMALSRHYPDRCGSFSTSVLAAKLDRAAVEALTDAQLDARIRLLRNQIQQGWTLAGVGALAEGVLARAARRPHPVLPLPSVITATSHLSVETAALADALRSDAELRSLAAAGDLAGLRSGAPAFAAAFDAALSRVGHRGPGEAELSNPVLAESPEALLAAAALAAGTAPETPGAEQADPVTHRADAVATGREQAWDATARAINHLRVALRESGSRLSKRHILATCDDVFYLTCDELLTPPVDTRLRVRRRREEHQRLQDISLPEIIDGQWAPVPGADDRGVDIVALIEQPEASQPSSWARS